MMFGLEQKDIDAINSCFAYYPTIEQVIIYGSRAKGNYRNASDIDLTIKGNEFSFSELLQLENSLDDLMLPYKMDVSIFKQIANLDLIDHINRVGQVFYQKK